MRRQTGAARDRSRQKATRERPASKAERERLRETLGLDKLDAVDQKMLQIVLAHPAITDTELGAIIGIGRQATNKRRNRRAFHQAIDDATLDALAILQRNQPRAARKLVSLTDSEDEHVAFRASRELLLPITRSREAGGETASDSFARFLEEAAAVAGAKKKATEPAPSRDTSHQSPAPAQPAVAGGSSA